jgi:paraquat-inducible protein A
MSNMLCKNRLVNLLLYSALGLLLIGLYAPMITVEKFYVFANTVSLLSALQQLWSTSEWGLFMLILMFSVIFPIGKIALLLMVCHQPSNNPARHQRWLRRVAIYGKWSMLDVFVVAMLVVSIKLDALAQASIEPGLYAFAASVVITLWVSHWIGRHDTN